MPNLLSPEERARKMIFGDPKWDVGPPNIAFVHPETGGRVTVEELTAQYAAEDAASS